MTEPKDIANPPKASPTPPKRKLLPSEIKEREEAQKNAQKAPPEEAKGLKKYIDRFKNMKPSDQLFYAGAPVAALVFIFFILPMTPLGYYLPKFGTNAPKTVSNLKTVKIDASVKPHPLEKQKVNDEKTFIDITQVITDTPGGDTDLSYSLRVPVLYKASQENVTANIDLTRRMIGEIARFNGPLQVGISTPYIALQATELKDEIDAQYWLKNYIIQSGFTLQGDVKATSDKIATANYIDIINNFDAVHNVITAHINGNVVVTARFEMPIAIYQSENYLQQRVIDSFKLLNVRDGNIEKSKNFSLIDALKFAFPERWTVVNPSFRDPDRLSVDLNNMDANGVSKGFMRIIAIRRSTETNLVKQVQLTGQALKNEINVVTKEMIESRDLNYSDRFEFERLEIYRIGQKKTEQNLTLSETDSINRRKFLDQELRVAIFGDQDWYIIAYLLTPLQETSLYTWANNIRSFDLMLKSME